MTAPPLVLVVEHEPACPPAHLGTWLTDAGVELEVARPWSGAELPDLTAYDALLVLGGSMGAHDDATTPWLPRVKDLVRDAARTGLPTLGVCLGHQLIAVALGGDVARNPAGQQVGLYDVGWTPQAGDDPLVGPLATPRRGVQWNRDVVTALPAGATVLARTAEGVLQVVRFGSAMWGIQLHPEVDAPTVRSWAAGDRDDHRELGIDQEGALTQIAAARAELDEAWRPLAWRFAAVAGRPR